LSSYVHDAALTMPLTLTLPPLPPTNRTAR
jgi:hypothetical protein